MSVFFQTTVVRLFICVSWQQGVVTVWLLDHLVLPGLQLVGVVAMQIDAHTHQTNW